MKISQLRISGFGGIAPDRPLILNPFGKRTLFIGPNNSGKSLAMRCLHHLAHLRVMDSGAHGGAFGSPSQWWNLEKTTGQISIQLTLHLTSQEIHRFQVPNLVLDEDKIRVDISAKTSWSQRGFGYTSDTRQHIVMVEAAQAAQTQVFDYSRDGEILWLASSSYHPINRNLESDPTYKQEREWLRNVLIYFYSKLRIFDAVRALDRSRGSLGVVDGSELLKELMQQQQNDDDPITWNNTKAKILGLVNALFKPTGALGFDDMRMTGTDNSPKLNLYTNRRQMRLDQMGTGVSEVILLCASLAGSGSTEMIYLLEEPETHLHPGLIGRVMNMLAEQKNAQFIIASHSNSMIDALTAEDRIYHFYQESDGACRSVNCDSLLAQHSLLDSLGIRGSQLLQSNCVIWVEGPSDRLYLKWWLNQYAKTKGTTLIENADYSLVIYGGSNLDHFGFLNDDVESFIDMARISRFCAVLMDADLQPGYAKESLRSDKKAILDAADGFRFLALLTDHREIENDLPLELFKASLASYLEIDVALLSSFQFGGTEKFNVELIAHLDTAFAGDEMKQRSYSNRLKQRMPLTESFISKHSDYNPELASPLSFPSYVESIYGLIMRARKPDKVLSEAD